MRLLIFLGIVYPCYRAFQSWLLQSPASRPTDVAANQHEINDVMVQDPFCQVYFPRKDGVELTLDGQALFFCSPQCRDRYVALRLDQ